MIKKINTKVNTLELANVIRSLISFIVVDTKKMIKDDQKEEYIKHYLYELSRSMNGVSKAVDIKAINKIIEKDIKKHSDKDIK